MRKFKVEVVFALTILCCCSVMDDNIGLDLNSTAVSRP